MSAGKRFVPSERGFRDRRVRGQRRRRVEGHRRSGLGFGKDRVMFVCLRKGSRGWMCCGVCGLGVRRGIGLFAVRVVSLLRQ